MRLWLLRPVDGLPKGDNPWEPWWDKSFGFVVRAETEQDARAIADKSAADENRCGFLNPWLEPKYSTCEPLEQEGEPGMIIGDFHSA